jgi:hypothetical protein
MRRREDEAGKERGQQTRTREGQEEKEDRREGPGVGEQGLADRC